MNQKFLWSKRAYVFQAFFLRRDEPTAQQQLRERRVEDNARLKLSVMHQAGMARRYLDSSEVNSALQRGKTVECFLGSCNRSGVPGIRWMSLRLQSECVAVSLFESADVGSAAFVDVYEFGSLHPHLEADEPLEQMQFADLDACFKALAQRFPEVPSRLVNEGLVQDEYADFVARGRQ